MCRARLALALSRPCELGQASLMLLAVVGAVLVGAVVLFAFGNALGRARPPSSRRRRARPPR